VYRYYKYYMNMDHNLCWRQSGEGGHSRSLMFANLNTSSNVTWIVVSEAYFEATWLFLGIFHWFFAPCADGITASAKFERSHSRIII
jgi:hypothetical protein